MLEPGQADQDESHDRSQPGRQEHQALDCATEWSSRVARTSGLLPRFVLGRFVAFLYKSTLAARSKPA